MQQKLVPDLFIISANNPKQSKVRYFERVLSKSLKKSNFIFFRTQSFLIDKIIKNKRGLELITSHYSGYETSSEKFFISYV